jgi:preprotein translocase subunit SecE
MSAQKRNSARGTAVESAAPESVERRARPPKPKAAEAKQPNQWAVRTERLRGTYQDTMSEMKKINWPDSETTRNLTIVVVGISVVMGALLGGVDWALVQLLGLF